MKLKGREESGGISGSGRERDGGGEKKERSKRKGVRMPSFMQKKRDEGRRRGLH